MTKAEAQGMLACPYSDAPWTCIPKSVSQKAVDRIFVIEVNDAQAPDGARMVVLTGRLIVISTPPSFAVRQRFCSPCVNGNLVLTGEELAKQLIDQPLGPSPITLVSVKSVPPGAEIIIDGAKVGTTDQTLPTSPGKHVVTVEKPGFFPETREVVVESEHTAEAFLTLRRIPSPPRPLFAIGSIATGAVFTVFAGVSLYHGQQGGPDDRYRYTRATPVGVVTGLVGLGAVGAGIYLLWRRADGSGPTTSTQDGGAVVGWRGQF
jgi:hypothetical protein